jgi:hypothetical protein
MVPNETNKEVAYHTTQELICAVPEAFGLKAFAERVVITLLDDKLRVAFMCEAFSYNETISARIDKDFSSLTQAPKATSHPPPRCSSLPDHSRPLSGVPLPPARRQRLERLPDRLQLTEA